MAWLVKFHDIVRMVEQNDVETGFVFDLATNEQQFICTLSVTFDNSTNPPTPDPVTVAHAYVG